MYNSNPGILMFSDNVPLVDMPIPMGAESYANADASKVLINVEHYKKVSFFIEIVPELPEDKPNMLNGDVSSSRIWNNLGQSLGGTIMMGNRDDQGFILKDENGAVLLDEKGNPRQGSAYHLDSKIVLNPRYFDQSDPEYQAYGTNGTNNRNMVYVANVFSHEIGHDLGLDHKKGIYPKEGLMAGPNTSKLNIIQKEELKSIVSPDNRSIIQPKND